jgi:predicted small metal-binding protein
MKRFRCGDVVPGCDAEFTGTESEILAGVGVHAREVHGMSDISPDLVQQVRSRIS